MKKLTQEQSYFISALKGGGYKQEKEHFYLCANGKYTILGVACELYRKLKDSPGSISVKSKKLNDNLEIILYNSQSKALPPQVRRYFGFRTNFGYLSKPLNIQGKQYKTLMDIDKALDFVTLARIIEEQPGRFFLMELEKTEGRIDKPKELMYRNQHGIG